MKRPIETLQENATGFFNKVMDKYSKDMVCKQGCSKCCYTDISVFTVESELIKDWFHSLPEPKQTELKELWKTRPNEGACAFLYNDQCSIYDARPIICRTQGAPLYLSSENVLDYCPLNFTGEEPEKNDWLNLERLNTMLSLAAQTAGLSERLRLKKLKERLLK